MKPYSADLLLAQTADYERITRQIRWVALAAIWLTLPPGQPQSLAMMLLTALGTLYNISRYNRWLMRQRWFSSRISMLMADNLLVAGMVFLVARPDTAYTGLLGLIIITATYWYGLRGTVAVMLPQLFVLGLTTVATLYPPLPLDTVRSSALACGVLFMFGLLLERLTHIERLERSTLVRLDRDRQAEQDRLMALLNSLNEATAVIDEKGIITVGNAALQELAGNEKPVKGLDLRAALPLRHRVKGKLDWEDALQNSPQRHRDYVLVGGDKSETDLDITITPVVLGELKRTNYIVVCRDITKEKSLDEQREEFIAVASHELRTPLTIIEAALSIALLPESKTPDNVRPLIEQAHQNTAFLAGLVQDLTTLSEAQNDAIAIQLQPVDPGKLLDHLVTDYRAQAETKQLELRADIKPDTPSVLTTERHVQEILRNYISNAIKYTKKGSVIVTAEPAAHGGVLFTVKDTGMGISKADQDHLFSKFYRAENFQTRETGGTGLGLYLCLELADRINGKVWCTSAVKHGSTFFLEVPPFSKLGRDQEKVVAAGVSNLVDQL